MASSIRLQPVQIRPLQTHVIPMQSKSLVLPSQTSASQFDITSILHLILPMMIVVMMMQVMMGAMGRGEKNTTEPTMAS